MLHARKNQLMNTLGGVSLLQSNIYRPYRPTSFFLEKSQYECVI